MILTATLRCKDI